MGPQAVLAAFTGLALTSQARPLGEYSSARQRPGRGVLSCPESPSWLPTAPGTAACSPHQTQTQPLLLQGPPGSPIHFVSWRTFSLVYLEYGLGCGGGGMTTDRLPGPGRPTPHPPSLDTEPWALRREAGNPGVSQNAPRTVDPGRPLTSGPRVLLVHSVLFH